MAMKPSEFILGIDFGTSNSCATLRHPNGEIEIIKSDEYEEMFPSCVFLNKEGKLDLGLLAEQQALSEPSRFRDKLKRDLLEDKPIFLGSRKYEPYKLVAQLLAYVKETAERNRGRIEQVVLTVPAGYTSREKGLMRRAATEAGFREIDLLPEPVAAAMYYAQREKSDLEKGDYALVYDFGGGTFDVALLEKTETGYQFPGVQGSLSDCGGVDIDILIYQRILAHCGEEFINRLQSSDSDAEIRLHYELFDVARKRIKHNLTTKTEVFTMLPYGLPVDSFSMKRVELNQLIEPLLQRTIQCCEQVIADAGLQPEDISLVLLVGGSSFIPLVRQLLEKTFACTVVLAKKPHLAVCQGAALSIEPAPVEEAAPSPQPRADRFMAIPYNPNKGFF
ncbi:Hsp70 family protein [Heliobacterium gestii]|uniref:Chaperone protein DnaK n=1 Tax=Heliomicrobium gestii TaxID=2699 RepID=A0A845LB95_HELGE|nr:Hsp70 family protein [Heliomicrobium gestii]MBM7865690.1 molecular chaperone DnaK (HSP70) [Heliomicrobium gestii]MZP41939.1 Hsp70 family protein [Heliomicrobium gestii]